LTDLLSGITEELRILRAENAVIDGVLVSLNEYSRPSRSKLDEELKSGKTGELYYYVFDLLYYEDWNLCEMNLGDRKALLSSLLGQNRSVLYVDHVLGAGEELASSASASGLTAIVAKKVASPYRHGRSKHWLSISIEPEQGSESRDLGESLSRSGQGARDHTGVRFTNTRKIFWPEYGYTKGDLIEYYSQVAEFLLPYLRDRPVHMLRYPNGVEDHSFYQKNVPIKTPEWVKTIDISHTDSSRYPGSGWNTDPDRKTGSRRTIDEKVVRYIICNDRWTLLYMVNLGSIDLHPWLSRINSLESPDWAVLDLDAKSASFSKVVKISKEIGKLLRGIGVSAFLKTSGATGIHVFIPLRAGYTYEQSRLFCEGIARMVVSQNPDIATVERAVASRQNRVYVDFLQNSRGQTIVPPYVVRPVSEATVSMPLDWDELDSDLNPSNFTITTALERIRKRGDLFKAVFLQDQDLMPAISELEKLIKK
jgi:DNA ligase D-like protein (predicted polymerase)